MKRRTIVELKVHLGYGRRIEPDPSTIATGDPAEAHARWVREQKRRNAVLGAEGIPEHDPRWNRLRFCEALAAGVAERVARGRPGARVTLNGEPIGDVRVRLRMAAERPSDVRRMRFVRRALKVLSRAASPHRPEAVSALVMFRRMVEEGKSGLTRADLVRLQEEFDGARASFMARHGRLTADDLGLYLG